MSASKRKWAKPKPGVMIPCKTCGEEAFYFASDHGSWCEAHTPQWFFDEWGIKRQPPDWYDTDDMLADTDIMEDGDRG